MTNKLDSSCNAVFLLMYHLIIVVKYRKKIFDNKELVDDLKAKIIELSDRFDVEIIEQEVDKDHIHILFKAKPVLDMKKYINVVKGITSRYIRTKYQDFLKDKLWGKHFWSDSYYLATSGNVCLQKLIKYIEDQQK
jgi:REP element-mobilizing transposase RayT